jgi:hypothetical protein
MGRATPIKKETVADNAPTSREVLMSLMQSEGTEQLAALATEIRSALMTRAKQNITEPSAEDVRQFVRYVDMVEEQGGDAYAHLSGIVKLCFLTAAQVLSSDDVDRLLMETTGLIE